MNQSKEIFGVVAIEKEAVGFSSTTVANFILLMIIIYV